MLRARRAWLCAWLLILPGCFPGEGREAPARVLEPELRLVDLLRGSSSDPPPRHAIAGDARPVLHEYRSLRVHQEVAEIAEDGKLPLSIPIPLGLARHPLLVLETKAKPADEKGYYDTVDVTAAAPRRDGARFFVDLELGFRLRRPALARLRPERLHLFVDAWVPLFEPVQQLDTPAIRVPAGASLEFAVGLLEPAWKQRPVRFVLLACRDGACQQLFSERVDPAGPERGTWRQRRVALDPLAGSSWSLRFESHLEGEGAGAFSLPVWADPTIFVPRPREPAAWNLVLVSLDTLRADHLSSYGYARDTAPYLETQVAARGTVFDAAISAASSTAPSHMTLFTSLQPSVHGVLESTGLSPLTRSAPTLAEVLRESGFVTAAFTEGGAVAYGRGFERGFDVFTENPVPIPHRPQRQSEVTFPMALEWLEARRGKRFFLFVHTYEVHTPYQSPAAYQGLFRQVPPGLEPDPRLAEHRQPALYDRGIRYLDDGLEAFLGALELAGLLDRTLLVVTSDHGEEFFEHDFFGHGAHLYEEVLRVPLLFRGPGIPAGRHVDLPVGHVDLMPTLLDLLGVPVPAGLMGTSFADVVRGSPPTERRPVYSEAWMSHGISPQGRRPVDAPSTAVRLGERKLIRRREGEDFRYELYDLASDPGETQDLHLEQVESARELRALLERYDVETAKAREALVREASEPSGELDPERRESLRALGYLD